jgi:hypothetical protein
VAWKKLFKQFDWMCIGMDIYIIKPECQGIIAREELTMQEDQLFPASFPGQIDKHLFL